MADYILSIEWRHFQWPWTTLNTEWPCDASSHWIFR